MSATAIRVEKLSKMYRIGAKEQQPQTFVEALRRAAVSPLDYLRRTLRPPKEEEIFWALRDIGFEVKHGEVLGIIGRNGAGKSTLLKVLSRITEPTSGRAVISGRVASLLEVGTGFHPELTGRENIYMNGAILGMRRHEIQRKFDEIVDFSGIEKFLDTPVKRYSSGMYIRLAFAVAAHLEPDILIIDEVLAVGDTEFQKKCLGKIENVSKGQGRTVLFVSHNMGAINALCQRGIYLEQGEVHFDGNAECAVKAYLNSTICDTKEPHIEFVENTHKPAQILSLSIVDNNEKIIQHHPYDQPFWLNIKVVIHSRVASGYIGAHIQDDDLQTVLFTRNYAIGENDKEDWNPGAYKYAIKIPAPLLVPGNYRISVHLVSSSPPEFLDCVDNVCPFELIDTGSIHAKKGFPWRGRLSVPLKWEIVEMSRMSRG